MVFNAVKELSGVLKPFDYSGLVDLFQSLPSLFKGDE